MTKDTATAPTTAPAATKKEKAKAPKAAAATATTTTPVAAKASKVAKAATADKPKTVVADVPKVVSTASSATGTPTSTSPTSDGPTADCSGDACENHVMASFTKVTELFAQALELNKNLQKEFGVFKKLLGRECKRMNKKKKKRTNNGVPKVPSGITAPTFMSDQLCKFLGVEPGVRMTRPSVTSRIHKYALEKGLRGTENKSVILLDDSLRTILTAPDDGTPLTYFKLQKYMKHHFLKEKAGYTVPVPVPVAATVA
jgi:hypothetical protein